MEFDELKKTWKRQQINQELEYSEHEVLMLINNKMISFEKDIKTRDRGEFIASALVIIAFGILFFVMSSVISKIGCIVIILSTFFIAYKLKKNQPNKIEDKRSRNHTIRQHLKQELKNVQKQKALLTNIVWWYIAPPCLGLFLFTIGTTWYNTAKIIYLLLLVLMAVAVWYLNQRAVTRRFDPLLKEIKDSIAFIEKR